MDAGDMIRIPISTKVGGWAGRKEYEEKQSPEEHVSGWGVLTVKADDEHIDLMHGTLPSNIINIMEKGWKPSLLRRAT